MSYLIKASDCSATVLIDGVYSPVSVSSVSYSELAPSQTSIDAPTKYEFKAEFSFSKRALRKFFNELLEKSIAFPQISFAKARSWPRSSRRKRAMNAANRLYDRQYSELVARCAA